MDILILLVEGASVVLGQVLSRLVFVTSSSISWVLILLL